MSDKPLAGLVTAAAAAPLCAFCVLGPTALVSAGGWILAWLGGFGLLLTAAVVVVGSYVGWRALKRGSASSG